MAGAAQRTVGLQALRGRAKKGCGGVPDLLRALGFLLVLLLLPARAQDPSQEDAQAILDRLVDVEPVFPVNSAADLLDLCREMDGMNFTAVLTDDIALSPPAWPEGASCTITSRTTVVIRGPETMPLPSLPSPALLAALGAPQLDLGGGVGRFVIHSGGMLAFERLIVSNPGNAPMWVASQPSMLYAYSLPALPSILADPGAHMAVSEASTPWSSIDCSPAAVSGQLLRLSTAMGLQPSQRGILEAAEDPTFYLLGTGSVELPVVNSSNFFRVPGQPDILLVLGPSSQVCIRATLPPPPLVSPSPPPEDSALPSWVWVIVGLCAALLLVSLLALALALSRRRARRLQGRGPRAFARADWWGGGGKAEGRAAAPSTADLERRGARPPLPPDPSGLLADAVLRHSSPVQALPQREPWQGDAKPPAEREGDEAAPASARQPEDPSATLLQALWLPRTNAASDLDLELDERLGSGGSGSVWRARWQGAVVAVKAVRVHEGSPGAAALLRSCELGLALRHPHVVTTYAMAHDAPRGVVHVVMELCDRGTLEEAIKEGRLFWSQGLLKEDVGLREGVGRGEGARFGGQASLPGGQPSSPRGQPSSPGGLASPEGRARFPEEHAPSLYLVPDVVAMLRVLLDVATALAYVHSQGVVHGDVKPSNVLLKSMANLRRGYAAKLSDFGSARTTGERAGGASRAEDGPGGALPEGMTGTAAYMGPEMLDGQAPSPAADCYAFGMLMWELWTRQEPYGDAPLPRILFMAHQGMRPPAPADAPAVYVDLMDRCWAAEPRDRPSSLEITEALRLAAVAVLEGRGRGEAGEPREGGGGTGGQA